MSNTVRNQHVLVSAAFLEAALNGRFNDISHYASPAALSLWGVAVESVKIGKISSRSSPQEFADNFIHNGNFIGRKTVEDCEWNDVCREALFHNADFACMSF